jgi:hypothetical protein
MLSIYFAFTAKTRKPGEKQGKAEFILKIFFLTNGVKLNTRKPLWSFLFTWKHGVIKGE